MIKIKNISLLIILIIILATSIYYFWFFLPKDNVVRNAFQNERTFGNTFSLIDHNNNNVNESIFSKNPSIVFFGFTHCPEICPTTLHDISRWKNKIGEPSNKISTIFFTLDPKRDTHSVLKDYLSNFDIICNWE